LIVSGRAVLLTPDTDHFDMIILSFSLWILQQNMRDAHMIIYPAANHGSPFQHPERVVRRVSVSCPNGALRRIELSNRLSTREVQS
jgi:hypothetical protein